MHKTIDQQIRAELENYSLEELKQNFNLERHYKEIGCMESMTNPIAYQKNRIAKEVAIEKGYKIKR